MSSVIADRHERSDNAPWTHSFARERARLGLVVSGALGLAFLAIFTIAPQIDIRISSLFFDPQASPPVFPYDLADWMVEFTRLSLIAANTTLAISVGWLIVELLRPSQRRLQVMIVAFSLLLGPGLVINEVTKPLWSRARPRDATVFNGPQAFTPIYVLRGACDRNCSFPSGHGGAAFAPLVGAFVSRRRRWIWGGVTLGATIGFTRLISGSHFISDILASGIIVVAVAALVTLLLVRQDERRTRGRRISP